MKKLSKLLLAIMMVLGLMTPIYAESTDVAIIGDKKFATLNDAVASIQDDKETTIYLLRNVEDATGISVPSNRNIIFDFGYYTYTLAGPGEGSSGTETNGFQLLKDSNITMRNGVIKVKENPNNIKIMIQNYANLTLENLTIEAMNKQSAGTANNEDYALSINNGEIHFKGNTNIVTSSPDVIAFDICKFSNYPGVSVYFDDDFKGEIKGTILYDSPNADTHKLTVNGNGTINRIKTNYKEASNNAIKLNSGTYNDIEALKYLTPTSNVTVKLDKDVEHSITIPHGTVTLDLNGHKITNTDGQHTINNKGNLTIVGEGIVDNTSHARASVFNEGNITISGGEYTRSKEAGIVGSAGGNSYYVINNDSGSMTIENGDVHATGKFSSLVRNNGEMHVKGGKFSNGFITIKSEEKTKLTVDGGIINSETQAIQTYGDTTINDGSIKGQVTISNWEDNKSTTTINGGDINGDIIIWDDKDATKPIDAYINGGHVDGELVIWDHDKKPIKENEKLNIDVAAGSFTSDVSDYVIEGKSSAGVDGIYHVGDASQVQKAIDNATKDVVVIKGLNDIKVPEGVKVVNNSTSDIKVNGEVVTKGEDVVAKPEVKPTPTPTPTPEVEPEEEKPSTPTISCAGSKDKNCDGVVTCDEEKGLGWEWNNDKKVCEFKGNSNIYIVNTATK